MQDVIRGHVFNIIDSTTFDMVIEEKDTKNKHLYSTIERICITDAGSPELGMDANKNIKNILEREFKGKEVCCYVYGRHPNGYLTADIRIMP